MCQYANVLMKCVSLLHNYYFSSYSAANLHISTLAY